MLWRSQCAARWLYSQLWRGHAWMRVRSSRDSCSIPTQHHGSDLSPQLQASSYISKTHTHTAQYSSHKGCHLTTWS